MGISIIHRLFLGGGGRGIPVGGGGSQGAPCINLHVHVYVRAMATCTLSLHLNVDATGFSKEVGKRTVYLSSTRHFALPILELIFWHTALPTTLTNCEHSKLVAEHIFYALQIKTQITRIEAI